MQPEIKQRLEHLLKSGPQRIHLIGVCGSGMSGLARMLLSMAAFHFMRHGATEISLTVTESNTAAIDLYLSEGYTTAHVFDAAVWQREHRG